jgi:hypothetical protein
MPSSWKLVHTATRSGAKVSSAQRMTSWGSWSSYSTASSPASQSSRTTRWSTSTMLVPPYAAATGWGLPLAIVINSSSLLRFANAWNDSPSRFSAR